MEKRGLAVLVVGADGTIGKALGAAWTAAGATVIETTRRVSDRKLVLDLAAPISNVELPPADVAYLLAAATDLAACERDPAGTGAINATRPIELARRLAARGTHVVFASTNIVFDGTRALRRGDAPISPGCEYGRQKAKVEAALAELGPRAASLRLTKVVGPATGPFAGWIGALRRGETIDAFSDKVCAPVTLQDTAALFQAIGEKKLSGIFQASASRDITYVEAALAIARRIGARAEQVKAVLGRERGVSEIFRPPHTSLDPTRLRDALGWKQPDPEVALIEGLGL